MIYRRFRLRKSAPLNSKRWKCNWLNCAHGLGLAGMGRCPGEWWRADCPEYIAEWEFLRNWELVWLATRALPYSKIGSVKPDLMDYYNYPGGKASEGGA